MSKLIEEDEELNAGDFEDNNRDIIEMLETKEVKKKLAKKSKKQIDDDFDFEDSDDSFTIHHQDDSTTH
jgi:hypothetical protein